jgi:hypothetical protein
MSRLFTGFQKTWHAGQSLGKETSRSFTSECSGTQSADTQNNQRLLLSILQQGILLSFGKYL